MYRTRFRSSLPTMDSTEVGRLDWYDTLLSTLLPMKPPETGAIAAKSSAEAPNSELVPADRCRSPSGPDASHEMNTPCSLKRMTGSAAPLRPDPDYVENDRTLRCRRMTTRIKTASLAEAF